MPQSRHAQRAATQPEAKFGPYPGGISIAIWMNQIETDGGTRRMRNITVSPRRYRDPQTGEWKDAPSYRPGDIPALLFGLQKALEFVFSNPIPGQDERDGEVPY